MPGSSIPEQPDWFVWDGGEDLQQLLGGKGGGHGRGFHRNFLVGVQVQGTLEVGFDQAGVCAYTVTTDIIISIHNTEKWIFSPDLYPHPSQAATCASAH